MEDQPSTSKDVGHRDDPDDDKDEESRDDRGTNSGSSLSAYSIKSRLDMAATGPEMPKPALGKPEAKSDEKKKRKKRGSGRVDKRKKPPTRRQVIRRAPRRKPRARVEKKRDLSVSTIYTRLTSSGLLTPGCERCGHRCCRRRFETELRRYINKGYARVKYYYRHKAVRKRPIYKKSVGISECNQAGSRSNMLSPLFVNMSSTPVQDQSSMYCAISPEMIYESIRKLSMWKQCVETDAVLEYIMRNYPVNPDRDALLLELLDKLRIAAIVGIICQMTNDSWSLSCALQKRKLSKTHVTLFWKLYADTMRPIAKEIGMKGNERMDNQTQVSRICDNDIL